MLKSISKLAADLLVEFLCRFPHLLARLFTEREPLASTLFGRVLARFLGDRLRIVDTAPQFQKSLGAVVFVRTICLDGLQILKETLSGTYHPNGPREFAKVIASFISSGVPSFLAPRWVAQKDALHRWEHLYRRAEELNSRAGVPMFSLARLEYLEKILLEKLSGAVSLDALSKGFPEPPPLEEGALAHVQRVYPDSVQIGSFTIPLLWEHGGAVAILDDDFIRHQLIPSGRYRELLAPKGIRQSGEHGTFRREDIRSYRFVLRARPERVLVVVESDSLEALLDEIEMRMTEEQIRLSPRRPAMLDMPGVELLELEENSPLLEPDWTFDVVHAGNTVLKRNPILLYRTIVYDTETGRFRTGTFLDINDAAVAREKAQRKWKDLLELRAPIRFPE